MKLNWNGGILWAATGLRINLSRSPMRNTDGVRFVLHISDLNPQAQIVNAISPADARRIGIWFIWRSFFPNAENSNK